MIRVEADEVTYPLHIILRCAAPAPPANARCWMLWFPNQTRMVCKLTPHPACVSVQVP